MEGIEDNIEQLSSALVDVETDREIAIIERKLNILKRLRKE